MAMPEPAEMPSYMSIFQYMGDVFVNGRLATIETRVTHGDIVETGPGSEVAFVLEKDAWQLPENTKLQLPVHMTGGIYHLEQGAALGVFASRQVFLSTPDAVVGIRGTGVYTEIEPTRSYICTCYGETEIVASRDPSVREVVVSKHHDDPKYVMRTGSGTSLIQSAPFKNHEDKELMMIETLVGREMPDH